MHKPTPEKSGIFWCCLLSTLKSVMSILGRERGRRSNCPSLFPKLRKRHGWTIQFLKFHVIFAYTVKLTYNEIPARDHKNMFVPYDFHYIRKRLPAIMGWVLIKLLITNKCIVHAAILALFPYVSRQAMTAIAIVISVTAKWCGDIRRTNYLWDHKLPCIDGNYTFRGRPTLQ